MSREVETITQKLVDALEQDAPQGLLELLQELPEDEVRHSIASLKPADQRKLLEAIPPEVAAQLIQELPESQAVQLLDDIVPRQAAAILDHLPSDEQADILGALPDAEARDLLARMMPEEAGDAMRLLQFAPDTAGGLMITEYLAFLEALTISEIIDDLRINAERYRRYDVQYFYSVDEQGRLKGVLRVRDLLLSDPETQVAAIAISDPISVTTATPLDKLEQLFAHYQFYGLPVVDDEGRLVGMLRRQDVEEGSCRESQSNFLEGFGNLRRRRTAIDASAGTSQRPHDVVDSQLDSGPYSSECYPLI